MSYSWRNTVSMVNGKDRYGIYRCDEKAILEAARERMDLSEEFDEVLDAYEIIEYLVGTDSVPRPKLNRR